MIVHKSGTARQYTADDVQCHPMVLVLIQGDNRVIFPWDTVASVEVKVLNEKIDQPNAPENTAAD